MKHSVIVLASLALCLSVSSAFGFDIAKKGRARATVVTGAKPSVVVDGMAKELAAYLKEMTGAEIKVTPKKQAGLGAIRLEIAAAGKMAEESFAIKDVKRTKELVITGADDRGLVYGVYQFLEALGCGFWAPNQETIPKNPSLSVPAGFSLAKSPAFAYRDCSWSESCCLYPKSGEYCRKIGINHTRPNKPLADWLGKDAYLDINHSVGGNCRFINHKKHFDQHPEWFALRFIPGASQPGRYVVKGGEGKTPDTQLKDIWSKRYNKGKGGDLIRTRIHVCTTNPELRKELVKEIRAYLRARPQANSVSIGADDDNNFCQCKRCEALVLANGKQLSSLMVDLGNYVAKEIEKEFPKITVHILAYWMTEIPPYFGSSVPKSYKESLSKNLSICLAYAMYRGPFTPIFEDRRLVKILEDWQRIAPVVIWGYYANFANYIYPYDDIFNMGSDLRGYQSRGVQKLYMQMTWGTLADFGDLRTWLFGKLTWDPKQDDRALITQWVNGTCGKGAPFIDKYLDLRYKAKQRAIKERKRDYMTGEVTFEAYQILHQAMAATKDDPVAFARVERIYAGLMAHIASAYNRLDLAKAARAAKVKIPTHTEFIDQLEALFVKYKGGYIAEHRYGHQGYIELLRKNVKK